LEVYYTNLTLFKDVNTFDLRNTNSTSLGNMTWDAGLQYKLGLGKRTNLTLGLSGQTAIKIKPQRTEVWERVSVGTFSILIEDTTSSIDTSGTITLPMTINAGIQLKTTNKKGATWLIGTNFKYTQWSKFKSIDNIDTSFTNNYRFSIGGAFFPKKEVKKYFSNMVYNFGIHYGTSKLKLNNFQDSEYGMNFGVIMFIKNPNLSSLPKFVSQISITFELGKNGNINKSLISENYFRILTGFTLNDKWFVKRKFN